MVSLVTAVCIAILIAFTATAAENAPSIEIARHKDAETMQLLLARGGDPDARQSDGATALHWAIYREDVEMVAVLIHGGASVNLTNRLGASPLYLAAKSGNNELISILLKAGANPDLALKIGETPLMTAARSGAIKGVEEIIAAGANVNAIETARGQTALMWAAAQGHDGVVKALIDGGADTEIKSVVRPRLMYTNRSNGTAFDQGVMENLGGYSALLFAARNGHVAVSNLLINAGADINGVAANLTSPLVVATHSGHTDLAIELIKKGAEVDAIGAGYNALHAAILRGDLDVVKALIDHGANTNIRLLKPNPIQRASEDWAFKANMVGATPYWIAASFREPEIMSMLAIAGADPLMTNEEIWSEPRQRVDREAYTREPIGGFETAVQAAVKGDSTRDRFYVQANRDPQAEEKRALKALITAADHGVDVNHADLNGATALHFAAARNLPSIARELIERHAYINALNDDGKTPLDLAIANENNISFFNFNLTLTAEASASEVLTELGASRSN